MTSRCPALPPSTLAGCAASTARSGSITFCAEPPTSATDTTASPFTYSMSRVTVTTVVSRGFCTDTDCGMAMFLVFGRISVSAVCTSRYTTRIVSMSIMGTRASGP